MVRAVQGGVTRGRLGGFRVWHLSLLVLFVSVAIVNIQEQRVAEPELVALASAGFVAYGVLGCLGWVYLVRARERSNFLRRFIEYAVAMSFLFIGSTAGYVAIENFYRMGHL